METGFAISSTEEHKRDDDARKMSWKVSAGHIFSINPGPILLPDVPTGVFFRDADSRFVVVSETDIESEAGSARRIRSDPPAQKTEPL